LEVRVPRVPCGGCAYGLGVGLNRGLDKFVSTIFKVGGLEGLASSDDTVVLATSLPVLGSRVDLGVVAAAAAAAISVPS